MSLSHIIYNRYNKQSRLLKRTISEYLTRVIYVRHNSGDLNDLGTKI